MKLKIAARLINKDRNRAFEIVKQVAESPVGLIATTDDDFVYNKGKFDNNWNNDFSVGVRYATSYRLFGKQQRSAFALFLPKE